MIHSDPKPESIIDSDGSIKTTFFGTEPETGTENITGVDVSKFG